MIYTCTYNPAIDYKIEVASFTEGTLNRTTFNKFVAGGKGINVSIVLNNLGINNVALGFIGGFTGKFVNNFLQDQFNLNSNFTEIHDITRVNVKLKNTDVETEINALGPIVSKEDMSRFLEVIQTLKQGDIIAIGGSPARGFASNYIDLVSHCKSNGIEFIIDSNNNNLIDTLKFNPLLVKPNIKELNDLFSCNIETEQDIIKYAKELVTQGAKNVIVSMGGEGSIFLNKTEIFKAKPITGEVKNTVGAGDSMVAGFITGLSKGLSNLESYKLAVACGTATAFSFDLAKENEINYYLDKLEIEVLNIED